MIKVRVVNESKHELPKYATEGDAGMDLRADLSEDIVMGPLERVVVPTGIKIQLPVGFEAQVRPRSGLAAKFGITVLNSPGTIDSTYTGVIGVILINLSQDAFVVKDGDRIAQLVVAKHECVDWDEREVLEITERGDGGFGHTGVS